MSNLKATSSNQESFSDPLPPINFNGIYQKILRQEQLCPDEIFSLTRATLPQLLKLIETASSCSGFRPERIKAVFFLPLNKTTADKGSDFALTTATRLIENLRETIDSSATLFCQLDDWVGDTPLEVILGTLEKTLQQHKVSPKVAILPPSSDELSTLWKKSKQPLKQFFSADFFYRLQKIGVTEINGNKQHQILRIAAAHNCQLALCSELEPNKSLTDFAETLLELNEASYRSDISSWTLKSKEPNQLQLDPAMVFRAIAIARLILRNVNYIGLNSTLFDPQLLRIAKQFGVNDFGWAGIDSHTASYLQIPTLSEAEKITGISLASPAICSYTTLC